MKKAIITFGVGYTFENISCFLKSCQLYCPDADIYMYVGKNIELLKQDCRRYPNLHLIRYKESVLPKLVAKGLGWMPPIQKMYAASIRYFFLTKVLSKEQSEKIAIPLLQFMVKRFFLLEQLIQELPHEQFMITDLRDVLLQADPFNEIGEKTIITGVEPILNGESAINANWIRKTFDEKTLTDLTDLPVACAGVTIGSRKAIEQYVSEMNEEVLLNLPKIIGLLGPDQAIHIYLFYKRLKGLNSRTQQNGQGIIATLHYSKLNEFEMIDGQIKNKATATLAVVHQYDRHPSLAAYLQHNLVSQPMKELTTAP
jgi:hypothetical protein